MWNLKKMEKKVTHKEIEKLLVTNLGREEMRRYRLKNTK